MINTKAQVMDTNPYCEKSNFDTVVLYSLTGQIKLYLIFFH